jgi:hypothetical protein
LAAGDPARHEKQRGETVAGNFKTLGADWELLTPVDPVSVWWQARSMGAAEFARSNATDPPAAGAFAAAYGGGAGDRGTLSDLLPPADGIAGGGLRLWGRAVGVSATIARGWSA